MKEIECQRCKNIFNKKEIYTIQQFQYRKEPSYKWSLNYFKKNKVDEWDSLCENCTTIYGKESLDYWNNLKKTK